MRIARSKKIVQSDFQVFYCDVQQVQATELSPRGSCLRHYFFHARNCIRFLPIAGLLVSDGSSSLWISWHQFFNNFSFQLRKGPTLNSSLLIYFCTIIVLLLVFQILISSSLSHVVAYSGVHYREISGGK